MENNFNLPRNNKKRVVIIGAGFGGLKLARKLSGSPYQVVVIDKQNFHQFQPLFYQVAASGIEPSSISFPVRKIFQSHSNLHFRTTELLSVNTDEQQIQTKAGALHYDYLVLANGVNTNYFGSVNLEKYSLPMKSTAEAINLRNRILSSFEQANLTEDTNEHAKLLSIVIVGGGPTGVELAGSIAEMRRYVLPKDYPELDFSKMKIMLFEAGPRLLNGMSDRAGKKALEFLKRLGVKVHLDTRIDDYNGDKISLSDGKELYTRNLIWTAGVSGRTTEGINGELYVRGNRIAVDRYNRLQGFNTIFAIGDACLLQGDERYPNGHPQVAQVAIQQAANLARNLTSQKEWKPFRYTDKGSLATIGRNMAVADLPGFRFSGVFAWMLWLFVHLMAIVGVKNRFFIFVNWAQSYFSRDQSLRILISPYRKK
ncbi:NAD(P)/FAD-dependent oxidoreductase [Carboxylicivirga sediminis]|uniref:NADH:ubiquinone reductase (non-electrogenic) n=1 Tax=Carboxylicivirga sediminis TaxID=2006564 RepID=A0A941F7S3_9BACT|nr:NAD(P)/FAD-dependent oxidoreductase [Carboxylicivirga sediminis]MBR8536855.1 NAD(P)/FAD-dependent oxidoreductase [Carboxylicivirga sediminis]